MLNKLVLRALLSISLAFTFLGAANAALITQDIISDSTGGIIGSISVDTSTADDWGYINEWVTFEFFGFEAETAFLFEAEIDKMDKEAGILALDFDVNDLCFSCEWAYSGSIEAGFDDGFVDIFDANNGDFIFFADDVYFGDAAVLPEPAALLLFFTGLMGLVARRKKA